MYGTGGSTKQRHVQQFVFNGVENDSFGIPILAREPEVYYLQDYYKVVLNFC